MALPDGQKTDVFKVSRTYKVLIGGFSGMMMAMVTHPLDLVKVRMQVFPSASSTVDMAARIARCEGFSALYSGLSAGLMRQATYTTTRLGVYLWMYEQYRNVYGVVPPLPDKMLMGAYAAMAGAFAGNPSEVILVRMMADGRRDPCGAVCGPKRHYRGLYDAVYKITSTEGFFALWRGGTLTLTRSSLLSFAQIGVETQARAALEKRELAGGTRLLVYTAFISSLFTAVLTLPVDLVKTRYQFNRHGVSETQTEVLEEILRSRGFTHLWDGFIPYFTRLFFHSCLGYIILDKLSEYYTKRK